MAEQEQQHAVADEQKTDEQAKPASEDTSARETQEDDLETLLAEYEEQPQKADTGKQPDQSQQPEASSETNAEQQRPQTAEDIEAVKRRLDEQERREAERQYRQDMDETVKGVRGDLPGDFFDDKFIESWIDAEARDDPRLQRAWQTRRENPKQFARVREELGRKFHAKYSKLPDKQATEDHAAVTQAVQRESNRAPEAKEPDFSTLSDADFREKVQKDYGFVPEV